MAKNVVDYKNSCFVDETIVNNKEVIYGALFLNNYPPSSVIELKNFVKRNIHLVKKEKMRVKYLTEVKSSFFTYTRTTKHAKKLINKSEIRLFERYSSNQLGTELENREYALKKLIKMVQCKTIYIDEYENNVHKTKMKEFGYKNGKEVIFVDSESEPGIQLADALHRLY